MLSEFKKFPLQKFLQTEERCILETKTKKDKFRSVTVTFVVPICVAIVLATMILVRITQFSFERSWIKSSQNITRSKSTVTGWINDEIRDLESVADEIGMLYTIFSNENISQAITNNIFQTVVNENELDSFEIFNRNGNLVSPARFASNTTFSSDVQKALNGEKTLTSLYENNKYIARAIVPVYSENQRNGESELIGACQISYNLTSQNFMNQIRENIGCEFSILKNDRIIASSVEGRAGQTLDPKIYAALQKDQTWNGRLEINGNDVIGCYWTLDQDDISFFVGDSIEILNNAVHLLRRVIIGVQSFTNIAIAVLIITLFIIFVTRPLVSIRKSVDALCSKDADLTFRFPVKGNDEFTALNKGFNKYIEMNGSVIKSVLSKVQDLRDIVADLEAASHETASATVEIMSNIESVKNQSDSQSQALKNTNGVIEASYSKMVNLNENIVAQTSDITESSAAIEEMIGNIGSVSKSTGALADSFSELKDLINEGSTNTKTTTDVIKQIEEKSKSLADANNTIKSISSQTNLLAMNAMIESAHAGEAGKGFAVVADEIRKLAEDSGNQAKAIDENIKDITNLILESGRLSELSMQSFDSIDNQVNTVDPLVMQISNAMEEQTGGSSQILEALTNMKSESVIVDESAKALHEALNNVSSDMNSLNEISHTILGSMDEMATGSKEISQATQNVSDLAFKTKDELDDINELIGRFKVE